jgi:ATP-binding cassette subfamily F protein uup
MLVDESMKVIDAVRRVAEYVDLGGGKHLTAMQFLQHFMFTPLQQQNYIYKLSGGERRRLQLCTVLMQNPNFLILDEPTNDMDIVTLQILEQYLQDFKGCVIIVSHDRYFMDKVVDHLLVFQGNGQVKDYPGNYTQFRDAEKLLEKTENGKLRVSESNQTCLNCRAGADSTKSKVKTENSSPSANGKPRLMEKKRKLTFKERQEFEQLEKDIETLEQEKTDIETALSSGTISVDEITTMSKRLLLLNDELDEKSMRWLELSEFA